MSSSDVAVEGSGLPVQTSLSKLLARKHVGKVRKRPVRLAAE